jgi:hypothetical protein
MKRKTKIDWEQEMLQYGVREYERGFNDGALKGANKQIEEANVQHGKIKMERFYQVQQLINELVKLI